MEPDLASIPIVRLAISAIEPAREKSDFGRTAKEHHFPRFEF